MKLTIVLPNPAVPKIIAYLRQASKTIDEDKFGADLLYGIKELANELERGAYIYKIQQDKRKFKRMDEKNEKILAELQRGIGGE